MMRIPPQRNIFTDPNATINTVSPNPPKPNESLESTKSQRSMSHAESEDKQKGPTKRTKSHSIYVKPETNTYIGVTKDEFESMRERTKSHFLDAASRQ